MKIQVPTHRLLKGYALDPGFSTQLETTGINEVELAIAQAVGTNLWPLKQKQTNALIKHAYVMTKIFLPLYCPSLITKR